MTILIPKEKRSLVITQNGCCDRLTRNSSTQNRKFLTSLCEFSLVFESEANTGKVTDSASITSIGSEDKTVTIPDFHLKTSMPTVCLPAAGWQAEQGAGC